MTTRRRSFVHATAIAYALSCFGIGVGACDRGGQSGDDGQMVEHPQRPDASAPGDAGPDVADAGAPTFVVPCCGELEGGMRLVCAAEFDARASIDSFSAALDAPFQCVGSEGLWRCTCDGADAQSRAVGCVAALQEACGKQAAPIGGGSGQPASSCETTLASRAGRCEQSGTGTYACRCDDASNVTQRADSCEAALWAACATDCDGATDSCTANTTGPTGSYRCDCPQYPDLPRDIAASTCSEALISGCALDFGSDFACNGYSGFCDQLASEFRCTCLDGSSTSIGFDDLVGRWGPCQSALEIACGNGGAPPGKECFSTGNDFKARCVQTLDDDAPFTCSCLFHGPDGEAPFGGGPISDMDCEQSLVTSCPQLQAVDADARARTCDYYDRCDMRYVGFDLDTCMASSPDACVACTNAALDELAVQDSSACPDQRVTCPGPCTELVDHDVAVGACKAQLETIDRRTDEGECLCERCFPTFGACVADAGCVEMLDCIGAQGCMGDACATDAVCGPVIARYQSTHSLGLLLALGACPDRNACAP